MNAADITKKAKKIAAESELLNEETTQQLDIFNAQDTQLADEINSIDVMSLTPIQAIQVLFDLQKKTKGM